MGSCFDLIIFFLCALLINFSLTTGAQPQLPIYVYHFCLGANYSANSTYESNLKHLLSSLSSNNNTKSIDTNRYYNSTVGRNPDTVYGSLQCRADVDSSGCKVCVNTATRDIRRHDRCPNSKQANIFYNECTVRFSDRYFFSIMQDVPLVYRSNAANISNPDRFTQIAAGLLSDLTTEAVANSSVSSSNNTLFATGYRNVTLTNIERIYGFVQCTSDLAPSSCNMCLGRMIARLPTCCNGKQGGKVITPSCIVRYEVYPFVLALSPPGALLPLPPSSSNGTIMVVIPVVAAVLLIAVAFSICLLRRKATREKANREIMQTSGVHLEGVSSSSSRFYKHNEEKNGVDVPFIDFETILAATDNFSISNKLGQGGFGPVFKGTFKGGQELAVKRLSRTSGQGFEEFRNEVLLIGKLQHRNLVKLLGYCIKEEEKVLLYEYMPNKSLDSFIFDRTLCLLINWEKRLDIILGTARGILYLHQDSRLRIIHRDLKTSNILLDEEMNPKISDFGLARICGGTQTEGCTSTVVGTYGYMAPEYALDGIFSVKSDVYSFGVVLLEIISGKKNTGFHVSDDSLSFIGYAWRSWNENKVLEFIDDSLREGCDAGEVFKCIQVGLLCVQEDANDRPTMFSAVYMLGGEATSIPTPKQPTFVFRRYQSSTTTSSSRPVSCSTNEITVSVVQGR